MDCDKVFSEPRKRRLHLIDKHHYPKYFPFDLVYTGTLSFEQRKRKDQKNKERLRRQHDSTQIEYNPVNEQNDVDMDELTKNMSNLKIPKNISFGHRASPSMPQHRQHHVVKHIPLPKDIEMKETKVYSHPRKRGPKKKNTKTTASEPMIE